MTQTPGRTDDQGRVPRPPVQRISDKRVQMIKALAGAGAIALTIFDAKVSYDGFRMLALPQYVPMVLALLILAIQLASGSVQQLGMNPFQGVGGSVAVDFVWRWVLIGVYVLDIGSNAIAFGVGQHLSWGNIQANPIGAFTMPLVLLLLSCLLTFGDEILLRLVDRLDVGARANRMAAIKGRIDQDAYAKYLQGYQQRALDHADKAGSRATVDFDWLNGKQP
jgi:hypothetical protein